MIWHNSAPLWTDRVQIKYKVAFTPMHAHTKFGANQRFRSVVILVTRCSAACSAPSGQIVSVSNIKVSFPTLHAGPKFDANQRFRYVVILMTCCSASGIVAPPVDKSGPNQIPMYLVLLCIRIPSLVRIGGFGLELWLLLWCCSAPCGRIGSISNTRVPGCALHVRTKSGVNQRFRSRVILVTRIQTHTQTDTQTRVPT